MESSGIAKILALYFHAENVFDVYFVWKKSNPLWNVHNRLPQCQDFYCANLIIM